MKVYKKKLIIFYINILVIILSYISSNSDKTFKSFIEKEFIIQRRISNVVSLIEINNSVCDVLDNIHNFDNIYITCIFGEIKDLSKSVKIVEDNTPDFIKINRYFVDMYSRIDDNSISHSLLKGYSAIENIYTYKINYEFELCSYNIAQNILEKTMYIYNTIKETKDLSDEDIEFTKSKLSLYFNGLFLNDLKSIKSSYQEYNFEEYKAILNTFEKIISYFKYFSSYNVGLGNECLNLIKSFITSERKINKSYLNNSNTSINIFKRQIDLAYKAYNKD